MPVHMIFNNGGPNTFPLRVRTEHDVCVRHPAHIVQEVLLGQPKPGGKKPKHTTPRLDKKKYDRFHAQTMGSCLVQLTGMNQGVTTRSATTVEALVKHFYSFEVAKMWFARNKKPQHQRRC